YDFLYELVQKRITTFSYLKRVHEGRIHWFNTVCLSKEDLGMMYENARMKKRKSKITKHEDSSFQESGEYTYLFVPNIPFDLDYFQTFYTLCDMLVEVYNKLLIGTTNTVATNFIESVLKVDGKFKKIISQVSKEIDTLARNNLKEELRVIDPIVMMSPTN
ncbi:hypothetical protein C2G38_1937155, partial [Gigaspora rosea]